MQESIKVGDQVVYRDGSLRSDHCGVITEVVDYPPGSGCTINFDSPHPKYGKCLWIMRMITYRDWTLRKVI